MKKNKELNLQNILSDLVSFETITGNQKEIKKIYRYIASYFPKKLFDIFYEKNNGYLSQIIVPKGVDWKNVEVVFSGHVDVVEAKKKDFTPRIVDKKMYGRGTADMKAGVAAMIFAILQTVRNSENNNCALVLTSDEEIGGKNGAGYLLDKCGFRPKFVLIADGPRYDKMSITNKEKGILWLEVSVQGVAAHASRPWLGKNALLKLYEAIDAVREFVGSRDQDEWKSTAVLTQIECENKTINRIPDCAKATFDIRFTDDLAGTPDELFEKLKKNIPEFAQIKKLVGGSILKTDEKDMYVQKLYRAMSLVNGGQVEFGFGHGASDGRYFSSLGIPTVLVGPIGGNWHAEGEWVDLGTVEILKQVLCEFLRNKK